MLTKKQQELLNKFNSGIATSEELNQLEKEADNLIAQSTDEVFSSDSHRARIHKELQHRVFLNESKPKRRYLQWAASIAVLIALSISFFWISEYKQNDLISVSTTFGETKEVVLPDGSKVLLNAASTLNYPESFADENRNVKLSGEAIFEVTKNKHKPFNVQSGEITTTVLGTIFNIKAHAIEEHVTISLVEGLVSVSKGQESLRLEPNQEILFDLKNQKTKLRRFDPKEVLAWKEGILVFKNTSFKEVIKIVERRYGVKVSLQNKELEPYTVSGKLDNPNLNTLLETICTAKQVQFKETKPNHYLIY